MVLLAYSTQDGAVCKLQRHDSCFVVVETGIAVKYERMLERNLDVDVREEEVMKK